jgi:hypothetical protein
MAGPDQDTSVNKYDSCQCRQLSALYRKGSLAPGLVYSDPFSTDCKICPLIVFVSLLMVSGILAARHVASTVLRMR